MSSGNITFVLRATSSRAHYIVCFISCWKQLENCIYIYSAGKRITKNWNTSHKSYSTLHKSSYICFHIVSKYFSKCFFNKHTPNRRSIATWCCEVRLIPNKKYAIINSNNIRFSSYEKSNTKNSWLISFLSKKRISNHLRPFSNTSDCLQKPTIS